MAETFLDRLRVERSELEEKISKLDEFINHKPNDIFEGLDKKDQFLLVSQLSVMKEYLNLLTTRIKKAEAKL